APALPGGYAHGRRMRSPGTVRLAKALNTMTTEPPIPPEPLMPPQPFSAIIFDCDGTLVDTARVYHRAYNAVLRGQGGEMTEAWYFARLGLSAEALLREFSSTFGHELEAADLMEP